MNRLALSIQIWPPHHCLGSFTSGRIIAGSNGSKMPSASSPVTIDSLPPMWTSKLKTPDFTSCWIFPTMAAARPAFSSASMPKRCLKTRSASFLSSALAGIETTTWLSFLPAATILPQSPWADCPLCASAKVLFRIEAAIRTKRNKNFIVHPIDCLFPKKPARCRGSRLSYLVDFFLRLVFVFVILVQRQKIFGCDHAELLKPSGVDVQTPRPDSHGSAKKLLTVAPEQPVHEYFRRVGM